MSSTVSSVASSVSSVASVGAEVSSVGAVVSSVGAVVSSAGASVGAFVSTTTSVGAVVSYVPSVSAKTGVTSWNVTATAISKASNSFMMQPSSFIFGRYSIPKTGRRTQSHNAAISTPLNRANCKGYR